jgi:N-glycosylase/DNA lyase
MSAIALVTDADLARARQDPEFRHQLVADSLELLLRELNKMRSSSSNAVRTRQIREGVELAVRLADLLQRIVGQGPGATRAA